jgi:hypothetical protein
MHPNSDPAGGPPVCRMESFQLEIIEGLVKIYRIFDALFAAKT